ncbi:MAG TPA: AraC family transcriptional regulator [Steroidobacteraceae bacterium]|nr:AraC family transcriptional regulator [Steroidobacteraceae bacterium]
MDGSLSFATRASSPELATAPIRARSNDALSGLAPLLRVRPELRGARSLGTRWLKAGETCGIGSAAFHIVTEGACTIELIAGRTLGLQVGEVAVLPRGVDHRFRNAHADPSATTRVISGRLILETSYHNLVLSALPDAMVMAASDGPEAARICQLMQTIAYELDCPRQGASAIANDLATAALVMVVRSHLERDGAASGLLGLLSHRQAGRAVVAMVDRLSHPWSLGELAACAHASRASLVRMFRKQVKLAPLEFLLGLRMEVARRKLASTRATLGEIAAEIGYHSESAFSRAFRRRFGVPPGEVRDRKQNADMPEARPELAAGSHRRAECASFEAAPYAGPGVHATQTPRISHDAYATDAYATR